MSRTLTGRNFYDDAKRQRLVVYRSHGGVTRKTSVRYGTGGLKYAFDTADAIARRLRAWPGDKLAAFKF